jgi:pimeloyl-ACP methyl ester carboxylesterase
MWARSARAWAEHFRLYAVDVIGEPGFSAPSRPSLASDAYAQWLDDVCDALRLTQVSMVGASLGGLLALDYAVRRPGKVRKLALLAPAGIARVRVGFFVTVIPLFLMGRWGKRRAFERFMGFPVEESKDAEIFIEFSELIMAHHVIRTQLLPVLSDTSLRTLTMPLLAVVGARDIVFSAKVAQTRLERHVPKARVVCLPGAGHGLTDQTQAVLEFLAARTP